MNESGTSSQREESAVLNFDETLPSGDSTTLPLDVYKLQSEYARINQEDAYHTDNNDTHKSTDDRKERHRNRLRSGKGRIRKGSCELNNKRRNQTDDSEKCKISSEQNEVCLADHPLLSPSQSQFSQKKSSSTGITTREVQENRHLVENERKKLSTSLPSKVLKSDLQGDNTKDTKSVKKSRRTSEPTKEILKTVASEEVVDAQELSKIRLKSTHKNKPVSAQNTNNSDREKSEVKHRNSISKDSPPVLKESDKSKYSQTENECLSVGRVDNKLTEQTVSQISQLKTGTGLCKEGITRKQKESLENNSTTFARGRKKKSDQKPRKNILAESKTTPVKLPSYYASEEYVTVVAHDDGSEPYESACYKCQNYKKTTPATSYCVTCAYYLCDHCLSRHNRVDSKTDHHILKGNQMPGSFTVKQLQVEQKVSEKCSQHPDRNIKCFCLKHNSLCCTECKSSEHATCKMQALEDLLIQTPDVRKLKHQASERNKLTLNSLLKHHKALTSRRDDKAEEKTSIVEEIKEKSSLMTEHIKKLEKECIEYVRKTLSGEQSELDKSIEDCELYIKELSGDIQYLDQPKAMKESTIKTVEKVKQIEMKKMPERLQNQLKDQEGKTVNHVFKVNLELFKEITEATSLGELSVIATDQSGLDKTNETENSSCMDEDNSLDEQLPISISEFHCISGWTEGDIDIQTCFTAVQLLDDGTVLVSDQNNMKLKWFDSELSLIKSIQVSSEPWGITRNYTNKYIVTLPMEYSYQEVELINGNIKFVRKVDIGIECSCVVHVENQLLFAGIDGDQPMFRLSDLDGINIENVFTLEKLRLFKRPNHLLKSLVNPKVVFVSDVDRGVFAIHVEKKDILFHYTNRTLRCPMGMTMSDSGNVYICSQQTHSIHCISEEGQYLFSVPMEAVADMRMPQCICYLPHLNEFLLTVGGSYNIVRFKLK